MIISLTIYHLPSCFTLVVIGEGYAWGYPEHAILLVPLLVDSDVKSSIVCLLADFMLVCTFSSTEIHGLYDSIDCYVGICHLFQ